MPARTVSTRKRIADCTDRPARPSNLMQNATISVRPLGSSLQWDVYWDELSG